MLSPEVFAYRINTDDKQNRKLVRKIGRALLFYGLEKLGIKPDGEILLTPEGKPYFPGDRVYFNISHSGNMVVVAIFSEPLGIDVEMIRENKEKIARRFFHEKEWEYLSGVDSADFSPEFTGIWTKKESFIKMTGEGLKRPLNSFNVFDMGGLCCFNEVMISKEYKCHLCTLKPVDFILNIVESLGGFDD